MSLNKQTDSKVLGVLGRYITEHERILIVHYSTLGIGFAVMNEPFAVLECRMIAITPVNNQTMLLRLEELILRYHPQKVIFENSDCDLTHKVKRVRDLIKLSFALCQEKGVGYASYTRCRIRDLFSRWEVRSRYEIAKLITKKIPSVTNQFYSKPRYPKVENYKSSIFDAISIGITHYFISHMLVSGELNERCAHYFVRD